MTVVVVGGGISGLAAAYDVRAAGAEVIVLEKSPRIGGALRTTLIEGMRVEEGADAFLVRVPWAMWLAEKCGLDLVHPATGSALLYAGGRCRPLPAGTVLGIPSSLRSVREVLTPLGLARAALDRVLPASRLGEDPSVGALVRARLGGQVVDRLVDPLLGGVYAGSADGLSVAMTVPALARRHRSLLATAAARSPEPSDAPVFASPAGGMEALPYAVAAGLDVRTDTTVTGLERAGTGWSVLVGPAGRQERIAADAVVLAVPAPAAARLLSGLVPDADLPSTAYASVAIVTLVYAPGTDTPDRSGVLVAPSAGTVAKALTFVGRKWAHPADAPVVVRASVGRFGAEADLQRTDDELAAAVARDVATVAGIRAAPTANRVSRWGGALPQYAPGHLGRVAAVRASLPAGVALAGAAYDGVGVPACVRSGQTAASELLALLG
ncbi:MAG TPA: protoporphyrinogen oxidase [Mycobacteriales bacterium]